jgi:RNA polymerase primary sigma factor
MNLDANDPLSFYLRELATISPVTRGEEAELLQHWRAQDELAESASKRLIEANLSLVVSIAERHSSPGVQLLDLIQHGNEGLLLALKTFTESSSDNFSACAATCIEDAILRAVAERQSPSE